jgi:transcriptional regulator GlxA family with amidase domain
MRVQTERGDDTPLDTLVVGAPPDIAKPPREVLDFLQRASASTRRIASICVGAFILGEAGLLDGHRATTHWLFGNELQSRYPKARVE